MPSKRKNKLREDKLFEGGWFPISADMWMEPGEIARKLRFISDVNFPAQLVDEIKKRGTDVKTARQLGFERLADDDLLERVCKNGYLLITLDADFWSDKKIPLQRCGGLVQIEGRNPAYMDSDGFELLMVFLESFGGLRRGVKIKSSTKQLFIKGIGDGGKKYIYEIRPIRPLIYAREITEAQEGGSL